MGEGTFNGSLGRRLNVSPVRWEVNWGFHPISDSGPRILTLWPGDTGDTIAPRLPCANRPRRVHRYGKSIAPQCAEKTEAICHPT